MNFSTLSHEKVYGEKFAVIIIFNGGFYNIYLRKNAKCVEFWFDALENESVSMYISIYLSIYQYVYICLNYLSIYLSIYFERCKDGDFRREKASK